jgi:hypothetical protein
MVGIGADVVPATGRTCTAVVDNLATGLANILYVMQQDYCRIGGPSNA